MHRVQGTEMSGEKATALGAATGTGIALIAGGSFGEVVGAKLVGGAAGYLGGRMLDDDNQVARFASDDPGES